MQINKVPLHVCQIDFEKCDFGSHQADEQVIKWRLKARITAQRKLTLPPNRTAIFLGAGSPVDEGDASC